MRLSEVFKKAQENGKLPYGFMVYLEDTAHFEYITIDKVDFLQSSPPPGHYKVTNLYVDPATGKLVVQYDTTPTP